ncbi:MAG: LUD domain-containing protein [Candidatus Aminicenantales bacterium]|jgi:L-lactate utilization protein LutC
MVNQDLAATFVAAAEAAGAETFLARDVGEALTIAARLFEREQVRTALACPSLRKAADDAGLRLGVPEGTAAIAGAQAAVVRADFGAAETGTLVRLDTGDDEKLLWTLPPLCVCLLERRAIVPDLQSLVGVVSDHLGRTGLPGPQVSFVTGPSRTADIEGQLAIGVQGPARLVIGLIEGGRG